MEIVKFVFIRQECQPANIISGYTLEQIYALVVVMIRMMMTVKLLKSL